MFDLLQPVDLGWARFTPLLLLISLFMIFQFFISWARNRARTGWIVSYWYYSIFMFFVLPILIMYPFAGSVINVISTGGNISKIQTHVDEAYLVSVTGYACFLLGGFTTNILSTQNGKRRLFRPPSALRFLEIIIRDNYRSVSSIYIVVPVLAICTFTLLAKAGGLNFNLRGVFLGDGAMRPLFNIATTLTPISLFMIGISLIDKFSLFRATIFLLIAAMSVMLGSRSSLLGPILNIFVFFAYCRQGRMAIWKIISVTAGLLVLLLGLGALRSGGNPLLALQSFGVTFFYGNNYSDVRDFAWIISYWDREPLMGKTYLAGFISFIPSSLSDFRMAWAISRVTDLWVGFDPEVHPGLRPGPFGESYFNFGIIGVIGLGITTGAFFKAVDLRIRSLAKRGFSAAELFSRTTPANLSASLFITAGFFGVYVFYFLHFSVFILRKTLQKKTKKGLNLD